MRFLFLYKPADPKAESGAPPTPAEMERMGKLVEEGFRSGKLLAAEGCHPTSKGARVRQAAGKVTVIDGPFAESKELVAGFAIMKLGSREEAIEEARRFLALAGDGVSEIRLLHEESDFGPPPAPGR